MTAHKLRGASSEAVLGTMLTGLRRPGAGSRQPQSQSQALDSLHDGSHSGEAAWSLWSGDRGYVCG